MNELLVGYARVSTEQQDLSIQQNGLHVLGVGDDRSHVDHVDHVDHGLTGINRSAGTVRRVISRPFNRQLIGSTVSYVFGRARMKVSSTWSRNPDAGVLAA